MRLSVQPLGSHGDEISEWRRPNGSVQNLEPVFPKMRRRVQGV
jgi:hypothetical protein